MRRLLIALLLILLMGGVGFAGAMLLMPRAKTAQKGGTATARKSIQYKMPLGKFTFPVLQPTRIMHIVIDLDVFVDDVAAFERLNGKVGRARLRDATIAAASDMAETILWVDKGEEDKLDTAAMAGRIALKLNGDFPSVRSAQINEFLASSKPRD